MIHGYGKRQPQRQPSGFADQHRSGASTESPTLNAQSQPSPTLHISKKRSTGQLISPAPSEASFRTRFSLDDSSGHDLDSLARSPIVTEHDHGLGASGLRRIRQKRPPSRAPTLPPSRTSSRSPTGAGLPRSASMNLLLDNSRHPTSFTVSQPSFDLAEDLSRFPSESLHSFSFAHQSDEFLYARQNVLKRSMDIIRDRMGRPVPSSAAALASAQARATGDIEAQNVLELLARAHLIEPGHLPHSNSLAGPLTGPVLASGVNPFEKQFLPYSASPERVASSVAHGPSGRLPIDIEPLDLTASASDVRGRLAMGDAVGESAELAHREPARPRAQLQALESGSSSRTPTNESTTTAPSSPPVPRPTGLKRTLTDTQALAVQEMLMDALAQPFLAGQSPVHDVLLSPAASHAGTSMTFPSVVAPVVHGHTNRWVPAAQAIFTTEARPPWTILAANDLACLVFGVTKAEMRRVGILEVVQEERRDWLERKLLRRGDDDVPEAAPPKGPRSSKPQPAPLASGSALLGGRSGITAQLLSKPNSRSQTPRYAGKRAQTVHNGDPNPPKTSAQGGSGHQRKESQSVLLCGDVVPIQKRNGATGSASLWVKEKKVGLIWVLEEIHEDVAMVALEEEGAVRNVSGAIEPIWGLESVQPGTDVGRMIPRIPRQGIDPRTGEIDFAQIARRKFFTCPSTHGINIPCKVEQVRGELELRVSSFPHMAGIVVVCPRTLAIRSSNSVFCGALFGYEKPDGMPIGSLVPDFAKILDILTESHHMELVDGTVVPEHSFRRASASLGLREGRPDAATCFLKPEGLAALHRDGSELKVDVQMRVVKSEKKRGRTKPEPMVIDVDERPRGSSTDANGQAQGDSVAETEIEAEIVYALWITYSRHLHARSITHRGGVPARSDTSSPLRQPSPGQRPTITPRQMTPEPSERDKPSGDSRSNGDDGSAGGSPLTRENGGGNGGADSGQSTAPLFSGQLRDVAMTAAAKLGGAPQQTGGRPDRPLPVARVAEPAPKKTIDDFIILEDMGQGAFGQVKLARYKNTGKKVVLKYVTKRRILVDTWTRDRKLGTVPLEIHVLNFLRRPELRHPNIVEMESFFEDDVNYYIEMVPHGLPGMDLFDYIELRSNMDEDECRSIFVQVARAVHHLHTRAQVVHRDIKDENAILDGEGNVKLIDFGSAAYVKNGPFDVFVGTIDYAAPEVLAGKPYGGKEQDVWALGILLYTIIYKENPFYSIDEIMDRDLRVPFIISDESIDLVRHMLNRNLSERYTIEQVVDHPWCRISD